MKLDQISPVGSLRWNRVYLLVTAVGIAVLGMVWFDVPPVGTASSRSVQVAVILVYALISVIYWLDIKRWSRRMEGIPLDVFVAGDQPENVRRDNSSDDDR